MQRGWRDSVAALRHPWRGGLNGNGITGRGPLCFFAGPPDVSKLPPAGHQKSTAAYAAMPFPFAEAEGFEPPVRRRTTVFKTAAIDHSATPP